MFSDIVFLKNVKKKTKEKKQKKTKLKNFKFKKIFKKLYFVIP